MNENDQVLDSFLSAFLITTIISTIGCSLVILTAVYRMRQKLYYCGLIIMCCLSIAAGLILLPSVMAVIANKSLVTEDPENLYFCQFLGALSAMLHRTLTSSLCFAYIDRCILIWKPMIYKPSYRFAFCFIYSICNLIIAIGFVAGPFVVSDISRSAYGALPSIPFCVFVPNNRSGRILLLVDSFMNYVMYWTATCFSVIAIGTISLNWVILLLYADNLARALVLLLEINRWTQATSHILLQAALFHLSYKWYAEYCLPQPKWTSQNCFDIKKQSNVTIEKPKEDHRSLECEENEYSRTTSAQ